MTRTTWTGAIKLGIGLVGVAYFASACATKTQTGAAVGAGSGAAVGAGVGALAGGGKGDELIVKFNSAILFDTDKSVLKPQAKTDLTELANVLKEYPKTNLVIEGHTDNTGKKDHNKKLSVSRADAVITHLVTAGVEKSRLTGKGFADERPVADNGSADGRQQNRRVQVQIAANEELKKEDAQAAGAGGSGGMQPASQRK